MNSDFFSAIKPGAHVFVQGAAATPQALLKLLTEQSEDLAPLTLYHLHTEGTLPYLEEPFRSRFYIKSLFVGENLRAQIDYDRFDVIPCFLSEIPALFRNKNLKLDAALIHVSPPDQHGYCSLGTSIDVTRAAIQMSPLIFAQINRQMPRTHGDTMIHISEIDRFIEVNEPLPQTIAKPLSAEEFQIGKRVAALIEDGSTLQLGIGSIPESILGCLNGHQHLGLHSELWTDAAIPLIQKGIIDNSQKVLHPGKSVATFVNGSQTLFNFVNDNPSVALFEASYVNSPLVIMRNPKVVAVNSAIEIDLTGQVCADSIGHKMISGVGGQMDFLRAAALSPGGKPILALTSRSKKGTPRLTAELKPGAGVVTTRSHVHWVVTEYGAVNLVGMSIGERRRALIGIAHPEDRETLERKSHQNH